MTIERTAFEPTTIDLGTRTLERPDLDVPGPGWARLRRAVAGHRRQWAAAAAVTALLALAATAAGVPPQPWLAPHFTVPGVQYAAVGEQTLYVMRRAAGAGTTLTAYRLEDGAVRWRAPLTDQQAASGILAWDGVPLVLWERSRSDVEDLPTFRTSAFDPDTGRQRWSADGWPATQGLGGDRLLLHEDLPATDPGGGPGPVRARLSAVDLRTGQREWTRSTDGGSYGVVRSGDAGQLVLLDPEGQLTTYDLASGQAVASTVADGVTAPPLRYADPPGANLLIIGALAVVHQYLGPGQRLQAYDPQTLGYQWTVDTDAQGWPAACGPVVCILGPGPLQALDPATGEPAWSADWLDQHDQALFTAVTLDSPQLAGYLVVSQPPTAVAGTAKSWVLEAKTGQPVLELAGWQYQGPALGAAVPAGRQTEPVVTRRTDDATWFGRLHPDLAAVEVLGKIDGSERVCTVGARYLLCLPEWGPAGAPLERGEVQVWRIR